MGGAPSGFGVDSRERLHGGVQDHEASPRKQQHEARDELVGVQVVAGLEQQPHREHRRDEGVEEQDPDPRRDLDLRKGRDRGRRRRFRRRLRRGAARRRPRTARRSRPRAGRPASRVTTATTICTQIGKIAPGFDAKRVPMMKAKTASTIQIRIEMISRKSACAPEGRSPLAATSPIERPRLRRLITRAEKSWTAPMKTVPTTTHSERRKPAPDHGDGGSDDRRRPGDRGEVMPPEDVLARGHEVHAVCLLDGRHRLVGGEGEDALGQEARVEPVPEREDREGAGGEQCSVHAGRLPEPGARADGRWDRPPITGPPPRRCRRAAPPGPAASPALPRRGGGPTRRRRTRSRTGASARPGSRCPLAAPSAA